MKNEIATLTTSTGEPVVLRAVTAKGRLRGLLLEMSLKQVFRNDEDDNIEVTYTFPLPWGAVLTGLEVTLGGKRMRGQVMARTEAREKYEEAVESGDAPVMVEKSQAGVFTASLGSLKRGEEAVVELSYAQLLQFEQGRIRMVVPTTIAPRYGDPEQQGGLLPHQVPAPNLLAEYPFGVAITLEGQIAQGRISCPTHVVQQQSQDDTVRITLAGDGWLDRDFVLLMEGLEGQAMAVAGPDPQSGEGHYAVIASYYPKLPAAVANPLCLKILVDCSGSMEGDSIKQAQTALRAATQRLSAADWFAFSRFGTTTQRVITASPATGAAIKGLRKAVDATDADLGGTEMHAALKDTFAITFPNRGEGEEADVLLITDGEVWDAQRLVDQAHRSGHRIYAIGVGGAPAESLLREIAEATGGACEFVTPNEDMVAAVQRMLERMRSAVPVDCTVQSTNQSLWQSPLPSRIARDETVHVHVRLDGRPGAAPVLQLGEITDSPTEISHVSDDLVARLVAARQVSLTSAKAKAREIAERYQLVTDHTNLLLVIERAEGEKTDGMPSLRAVRPMVAAGWGGLGSVVKSSVHMCLSLPRDAVSFDAMATPSVWRTARRSASADSLAGNDMGDFEIPAFLRRSTGDTTNYPKQKTVRAQQVVQKQTTTGHKKGALEVSVVQILAAFNDAYRPGLTFRQVLRAVTSLPCAASLEALIDCVSDEAGSRLNAWALYVLAAHETVGRSKRLSNDALMLVLAQLRGLDQAAQDAIKDRLMAPSP